jgi:uncharacterized repeat protein (TIGR03803 family)
MDGAFELVKAANDNLPSKHSTSRGGDVYTPDRFATFRKDLIMKHLNNLVGACLSAALLAACGGRSGTPLSPSPAGPSTALRVTTVERTRVRPAYSVLYSFKGGSRDGKDPTSTLINVQGTLYGTTDGGGGTKCRHQGCGTVFTITTSGTETVLHSFRGSEHGIVPVALLDVKGTFYGTTLRGGANKEGTVFAIARSGNETVLHSFGGSGDGDYPEAGLINVNGTLYGTTYAGGSRSCSTSVSGCGTVFAITPSGAESVLHSFAGGSGDGYAPFAGLLNVKGTLYGTTAGGGSGSCSAGSFSGCGTVFSITTSGKETMLYSFKGVRHMDGGSPEASLVNVNGTLYGTTEGGGSGSCGPSVSGCGTVFAITTSGAEAVLYRFTGYPNDGALPRAGLLNVKGTLYGTNSFGGANCGNCGTVFAITTSGAETVLHSFGGGTDGYSPVAGLIDVKGTLYGTTLFGGASVDGTVFSLSP